MEAKKEGPKKMERGKKKGKNDKVGSLLGEEGW